ncbi:MAG TPA: hypothetical protein VEK56_12045 [Vicinamibacterales bacterium]|nr:hypothetical protein [Vicinamibacterales bacterium]
MFVCESAALSPSVACDRTCDAVSSTECHEALDLFPSEDSADFTSTTLPAPAPASFNALDYFASEAGAEVTSVEPARPASAIDLDMVLPPISADTFISEDRLHHAALAAQQLARIGRLVRSPAMAIAGIGLVATTFLLVAVGHRGGDSRMATVAHDVSLPPLLQSAPVADSTELAAAVATPIGSEADDRGSEPAPPRIASAAAQFGPPASRAAMEVAIDERVAAAARHSPEPPRENSPVIQSAPLSAPVRVVAEVPAPIDAVRPREQLPAASADAVRVSASDRPATLTSSSVASPGDVTAAGAVNGAGFPVDTAAVQAVLAKYRSAFRELDAGAVSAVWPTVNSKALDRAFRGLEQQDLAFDGCDTRITGSSAAVLCSGTVRYVAKVGNKNPRTEQRRWIFALRQSHAGWVIENVELR